VQLKSGGNKAKLNMVPVSDTGYTLFYGKFNANINQGQDYSYKRKSSAAEWGYFFFFSNSTSHSDSISHIP
jgi:hypothetical protein